MVASSLQRTAFRLGGRAYTAADALRFALLTGAWAEVERSIRAGVACQSRADAEGLPVDDAKLTSALREFRYGHNLISAEEAEAWLHTWALSGAEWRAAIRRAVLRSIWSDSLTETLRRHPPDTESLASSAWPDLVCTGDLERLVETLARHVAVAGPEREAGARAEVSLPLPSWLDVDGDVVPPLHWIGPAYDERRRREVPAERVRASIQAHPLDWTRVGLTRALFAVESMGAEAALRVRVDGESLAEVAQDVGCAVGSWEGFLDSADAALRARLVGAAAGEVLGPWPSDGGFALVHVTSRTPPREDDPALQAHVEAALWSAFTFRALEQVQWELPVSVVRRG